MKMKEFRKTTEIRKVSYVKYVRREKSFVQKLHTHAIFGHELVYVDYGQVDVILNRRTVTLNPGDCILIHGGTPHLFTGKCMMPFSYLNIMFRGTIDESLYGDIIPVNQSARRILEQLRMEAEIDLFLKEELIVCHFTELILLLSRSIMMKTQPSHSLEIRLPETTPYLPSNTRRHHSELVQKAQDVIREHYGHPLDMVKVAGVLNVSASHLRALLRKETGSSFTVLLHKARIEAAKHYLQEGTASLGEISAAVGYSSPAFFFTVFKRLTGITPREYSASLGENNFVEH